MGAEVRLEFIHVLVRTVVVVFGFFGDYNSPFLMSDRWSIGSPAYSMVTDIHLRVAPKHVRNDRGSLESLRCLHLLKSTARLTLTLDVIDERPIFTPEKEQGGVRYGGYSSMAVRRLFCTVTTSFRSSSRQS
jgi:hypothetical protein